MGGVGSGRVGRRPVAEEAITLRIRWLRDALLGGRHSREPVEGQLALPRASEAALGLSYRLEWDSPPGPRVLLIPTSSPWVELEPISLIQTALPHHAHRWWFACPACARQVAMLYVSERRWRCRCCSQATYRSSNRSDKRLGPLLHDFERYWLGQGPDPLDAIGSAPAASEHGSASSVNGLLRDFRLALNAQELALARLRAGRPLYRDRPARTVGTPPGPKGQTLLS